MKGKLHKRSGTRIKEREKLAAERVQAQQEPTPARRRVHELVLAREIIDPAFLAEEPSLSQSQWVQYGYMSALERTELFCRMYLETYRRHYERFRDYSTAHEKCPVDPELFKNEPSEINSLWRARQYADEIGMRYDMFLEAVMGWATNTKGRKYFPRPNQLYGRKQLELALDRWERQKDIIPTLFAEDWDDQFFQQNPKRDPPRMAALALAFHTLKKSTVPEYVLASLMGTMDALSSEHAKYLFRNEPELFNDAMRHIAPPLKVRASKTFDPYVPPCLGLRHDVNAEPCSQCKFALLCEKTRAMTDKRLHAKTGSSDPRAARKREQDRIRQRRKRDKDRASLSEDSLWLEAS